MRDAKPKLEANARQLAEVDTANLSLAARVRMLNDECERLKRHVDDLQSGMYVNCVYCGHRYGPKETTPVSMADALKAHVEQCPQHPMSKLKAVNADLLRACEAAIEDLEDVPGRHAPESLEIVRAAIAKAK